MKFNCQKHFYFKLNSFNSTNSVKYRFVYTQLNVKTILFQIIQFSIQRDASRLANYIRMKLVLFCLDHCHNTQVTRRLLRSPARRQCREVALHAIKNSTLLSNMLYVQIQLPVSYLLLDISYKDSYRLLKAEIEP